MRALVTGAARGIGAACALAFGRSGMWVACADRVGTSATVEAIANTGGRAESFVCDVSGEQEVLDLFARLRKRIGRIDVLVHAAGIIHEAPLLDTSVEAFDHVISVNLRGTFLVGREAFRMMNGRGGRLILIGSDLGYLGRETFSPYAASKHGVLGLVRSWAKEFAPDVLVNAICPGPVDTEMLSPENMSPKWRKKEADIPMARLGEASEIAEMAMFLAGPGARFITGQGIGVNGGSVMP